jgi:hypothetical protein
LVSQIATSNFPLKDRREVFSKDISPIGRVNNFVTKKST